MQYTGNFSLKKPDGTDVVNIQDFNNNADTVDVELAKKATTIQDGRMSKEDKAKLDGVATEANNYTHPAIHPYSMLTGAPTSLPANGGDADTVDGKHATGALITAEKSNLVAAINETFQSASDGKTNVASAITAKGVPASGSDTFAALATKIGSITTKSVLTGTAIAGDALAGKTLYSNNPDVKITGTIPSKTAATITPGTSNQTIGAGQYLSGAQTIAGDPDLVAANILSGKNIFGVAGNVVAGTVLSAGNVVQWKSPGSYYKTNNTYTKAASVNVFIAGTYRVRFKLMADFGGGVTVYGRIYKNGVAFGTERTATTFSGIDYSEDLFFSAGDSIEVWLRSSIYGKEVMIGSETFQISTLQPPMFNPS